MPRSEPTTVTPVTRRVLKRKMGFYPQIANASRIEHHIKDERKQKQWEREYNEPFTFSFQKPPKTYLKV